MEIGHLTRDFTETRWEKSSEDNIRSESKCILSKHANQVSKQVSKDMNSAKFLCPFVRCVCQGRPFYTGNETRCFIQI